MHEAMGVMLADCFHFQVDDITGDANMACYRTGGSKQGSTSIRDSCLQEMVRYYLKAYNAAQNGDHVKPAHTAQAQSGNCEGLS